MEDPRYHTLADRVIAMELEAIQQDALGFNAGYSEAVRIRKALEKAGILEVDDNMKLHNHFTRDIKTDGSCDVCTEYNERH